MGECFFWYRPTQVVLDQRPLNGRCCCCCVVNQFLVIACFQVNPCQPAARWYCYCCWLCPVLISDMNIWHQQESRCFQQHLIGFLLAICPVLWLPVCFRLHAKTVIFSIFASLLFRTSFVYFIHVSYMFLLVPAPPGSPEQNGCVCVCVLFHITIQSINDRHWGCEKQWLCFILPWGAL